MRHSQHIWKIRPRPNSHPARAGFTLVEVFVAIAVFSVIAVGIMGAIYSGIRLWGRARTVDFSKGYSLLAIESLTSELRQSASVSSDYLDSAVFEGDSQTISFPAV